MFAGGGRLWRPPGCTAYAPPHLPQPFTHSGFGSLPAPEPALSTVPRFPRTRMAGSHSARRIPPVRYAVGRGRVAGCPYQSREQHLACKAQLLGGGRTKLAGGGRSPHATAGASVTCVRVLCVLACVRLSGREHSLAIAYTQQGQVSMSIGIPRTHVSRNRAACCTRRCKGRGQHGTTGAPE